MFSFCRRRYPLLVIVVTGILLHPEEANSLTTCTNSSLNFQGYTFSVDTTTGDKVWSHCKFSNPNYEHARCGLPVSTDKYYMCDPDGLVSNAAEVNTNLQTIQTNTSTVCEDKAGDKQSYIVAIAVVKRIRIPDLTSSITCINDCGEIQPTLNTAERSPTSDELDTIMANFADYLRSGWGLGTCENDVVVFYCQEYNRVHTSVGSRAAGVLTTGKVEAIEAELLRYANAGQLGQGLLAVAVELRETLRGFTPAHAVLLIHCLAVIALIAGLVFFLHLHDLDLNVWGREKHWQIVEGIVMFLTGVWLIHAVFWAMAWIANRIPAWVAGIFLLGAIGCFVVVLLETQIFPISTTTVNFNFTG